MNPKITRFLDAAEKNAVLGAIVAPIRVAASFVSGTAFVSRKTGQGLMIAGAACVNASTKLDGVSYRLDEVATRKAQAAKNKIENRQATRCQDRINELLAARDGYALALYCSPQKLEELKALTELQLDELSIEAPEGQLRHTQLSAELATIELAQGYKQQEQSDKSAGDTYAGIAASLAGKPATAETPPTREDVARANALRVEETGSGGPIPAL